MKIITFGDYEYIPFTISSYRNLKQINRHNDITVLCLNQKTADTIKSLEPNCNAIHYKSKLTTIGYTANEWVYSGLLQYIKLEALREYVDNYGKAFYLDSDVLLFEDIFTVIDELLNQHNLVFKLYKQLNRFNTDNLKTIVNSGTLGVKKSNDSDKMFEYFFNRIKDCPTPSGNLEEYFLTEFYDTVKTNNIVLSDKINLLNSEDKIYTMDEIKAITPMSFHPTYPKNQYSPNRPYTKIEIAKAFNLWFYE